MTEIKENITKFEDKLRKISQKKVFNGNNLTFQPSKLKTALRRYSMINEEYKNYRNRVDYNIDYNNT